MFVVSDSLQCYTCKASGVNEVDANIRCLEKAYLEKCDEFYNYYNDVEEELYDYYYNFEDDVGDPDDTRLEDVNQATGGATEQDVTIVPAYGQGERSADDRGTITMMRRVASRPSLMNKNQVHVANK